MTLGPLIGFVFFGLFSPGPNVILITTSSARFGFKATLPHLFGVALGVGITAFATGIGLGVLIERFPALEAVLVVVASAWIMWMAWGLWNSDPTKQNTRSRPFTFIEAVLFQWVNPKVWAVAISATAYVAGLSPIDQAIRLAVTFSGLNLVVCLFWAFAGSLLTTLLSNPVAWMVFMRVMAVALMVFSVLVFF